jgi:outer membrane immunogenic protein
MTRISILAATAALAVATPAFAQEAPVAEAAAPAAALDFNGPRVGLNIGVADEDFGGTEALTYGFELGYDHDFGAGVVGAVGELQNSDETGREYSVGARAGFKPTQNLLVYGTASYANLKVAGIKLDGVRFGGGLEALITENVSVKAEQRYTNYELGVDTWQTVAGVGFHF